MLGQPNIEEPDRFKGRRYIPSMSALLAFEAAARFESFSRAGEELNRTQSAVSRQIRQLEELLGIQLFRRVRQRVTLTDAGAAYLPEVVRALNHLRAATLNVITHQSAGGTLNLAVLPTFGAKWLIPRLPDFHKKHPSVTVNLTTRLIPFDFDEENLDAAIHFGRPDWPHATTERILGEQLFVIGQQELYERLGIRHAKDMVGAPLLQHTTRPNAWEEWFTSRGVACPNADAGPKFEQFSMVAQAAIAGLGFGLLPEFLIFDDLESGRLIKCFDQPLQGENAYYLVYPDRNKQAPEVLTFAKWISEQGAADSR